MADQEERNRRLQEVLDRFEITVAEANDLSILMDYDIVVIADDSGSMQCAAERGKPETRWQELQSTLAAILGIGTFFYPEGIDVHFLNRQSLLKVKSAQDEAFVNTFKNKPTGRTPLTETLARVARGFDTERKSLLFILTDGEPNGGKGPFTQKLRELVTPPGSKLKVQIMACTSDDDEIEWLGAVDRELKQVDVTDDYYAERKEVLRAGLAPRFTKGDWVMKAMLGPISHKFDGWDELKFKVPDCGCCIS